MVISTGIDMKTIPLEAVQVVCSPAPVGAKEMERALRLLKLMSEPNRLKIFALLATGERCVCELEASMQLPQNLVSHHLGVLRDAGLIRARREGRWVHYSVNKENLGEVYPTLCRLFNPDCVSDEPSSC
jgi:ArsR family transcriptional regulator, arsenate/arsenite/antimonite-responsive transcriptional repressor